MLQHSSLPPTLIPQCLDVLLKGTSERDFMRIVVEIVQSLRRDSQLVTSDSEMSDHEDEEDSSSEDEAGERAGEKRKQKRRRSLGPEQLEKRKELDLRCLIVVKALLERVMSVRTFFLPFSLTSSRALIPSIDLSRRLYKRIRCSTVSLLN